MLHAFSRLLVVSIKVVLLWTVSFSVAQAAFYYVGPGMPYSNPSLVAAVAMDGDTIEIEAGTYPGDVAVWRQNDLTIRGVGGYASLRADGRHAEGKGIWVIKGANTTIENIEFVGAKVPDENGAGIRQEGANLIVRNCRFIDNENGILTGKNLQSEILIENSVFERNGAGDGYTHNIYIGEIKKFTLRYSYSHQAHIGHQVKSRAQENHILFNRLMDGASGDSSYIVDIPNGGLTYLVGNVLQQGEDTDNRAILSYAAEEGRNQKQELYVINNTFVNDRLSGVFVVNANAKARVRLVNNIFAGNGKVLKGIGQPINNLTEAGESFLDGKNFNYALKSTSAAVDKGIMSGDFDFTFKLDFEYLHPAKHVVRPQDGKLDLGAFEYRP